MTYPAPAKEHYLIGLTGNIGAGKSMVRKLLEHLGALGIDADWLARQAYLKGAPAFPALVARFGAQILDENGEVDRRKLAALVFADPQALKDLEAITHPLVSRAAAAIIDRSPMPVVAIEAIKLLESGLAERCRSIWVVEADERAVFERLQSARGMGRADARRRLASQSAVEEKLRHADAVIHNSGDLNNTWEQVLAAWNALGEIPPAAPDFSELRDRLKLRMPDVENVAEMQAALRAHPDSAPTVFLRESLGLPAHERGWFEKAELAFQSLARYSVSFLKDKEMAVWDINHFTCSLNGYLYSKAVERSRLEELAMQIEAFGGYHLCSQFNIQAAAEDQALLRGMGYTARPQPPDSVKAGYNLLTKSCPAALQIFQDTNGQ